MTNKKPKIRVGIPYPNNAYPHDRCVESVNALKRCPDFDIDLRTVQGASIARGRNLLVTESSAVNQTDFDFDYYLSLDADIEFTVDDVRKLIARDLDIVSGGYQMRGKPDMACAGWFGDVNSERLDYVRWKSKELCRVDWVGAGFLLIKKGIFQSMAFPYFEELWITYNNGNVVFWGEDIGFCMSAVRDGFNIFCDMDVKVYHLI